MRWLGLTLGEELPVQCRSLNRDAVYTKNVIKKNNNHNVHNTYFVQESQRMAYGLGCTLDLGCTRHLDPVPPAPPAHSSPHFVVVAEFVDVKDTSHKQVRN